jgi:hypothetical protein
VDSTQVLQLKESRQQDKVSKMQQRRFQKEENGLMQEAQQLRQDMKEEDGDEDEAQLVERHKEDEA